MLEPPNTHVFSLVTWRARDVLVMLLRKSRQGGGVPRLTRLTAPTLVPLVSFPSAAPTLRVFVTIRQK